MPLPKLVPTLHAMERRHPPSPEPTAPAPPDTYGLPPVLDIPTAAGFLGVDRKTVYAAISTGSLPARRVGKRRLVILRHVLLGWLSQERAPRSEDR